MLVSETLTSCCKWFGDGFNDFLDVVPLSPTMGRMMTQNFNMFLFQNLASNKKNTTQLCVSVSFRGSNGRNI